MKRLVTGILAHVDSGKTTLSEGLLYTAGEISRIGRVDHGDAFLDTDSIERDRGITIFSKQAMLRFGESEFTLLDTPGHVDFSAEMERTLRVIDYAILVISGADGVQSHTETLWKLLMHYNIPTFIFVNKTDLDAFEYDRVMSDLKSRLSEGCLDFGKMDAAFYENAAMADDKLLDEYMETESISDSALTKAVSQRKLFPCYFGSALKMDGVREFLEGFDHFTQSKKYSKEFGAKVFKITEDERGQRLTHMKITGGSLKVKALLSDEKWSQKANEVRIYSGVKYNAVQEAFAGNVCAVTGLTKTFPGEGLGFEHNSEELMLEPVFAYSVKLPEGADLHNALMIFKKLEEEETQLKVVWNEYLQKIDVHMMGEVQMEVLKRILAERFGLSAEFEEGSIIYKETISEKVEGVGHYEPLRHYAEVHLLMEPLERGSGLIFETKCSEDVLDKNWQRLIMTHLCEKTHIGTLTGSPITDMKITVINGRAHLKHTEGGDFRQATYRAVRQGLMQTQMILLEPWYSIRLEVPIENTGRAMTDLQQMGAEFDAPQTFEDMSVISGSAPVCAVRDYQSDVTAYTSGRGRLQCSFKGYAPCKNQAEVIKKIGYNCEADIDNTPDSVFCSHGSGFVVKWNQVFDYMHIPAINLNPEEELITAVPREYTKRLIADEEELLRIFERTYGAVKKKTPEKLHTVKSSQSYKAKKMPEGPEYLLIDGYNIIFAWDDLKKIAEESLQDARTLLIDRICNYQVMKQNNVILVFDAYRVKGDNREVEKVHGISVVYTKEAETADAYIEKATQELCKNYRVRVATSDNLEQIIIFGHGARRVSANEFKTEVEAVEADIRAFIKENNKSIESISSIVEK